MVYHLRAIQAPFVGRPPWWRAGVALHEAGVMILAHGESEIA